jgi:RNA recognition motif-containing protein
VQKQKDKINEAAIEEKKNKFRQFLTFMGVNNDTKGQSWNDNFQSFMESSKSVAKNLEKEVEKTKEEKKEDSGEPPVEEKRLYVMNLSYEVTHDELKSLFGKFGEIENIEIPFRKGGKGTTLGISYVKFKETEGAITAFATLDKTYF